MAKGAKKFEGLVLVINTSNGAIYTHTAESFEKNKAVLLSGTNKKFSPSVLKGLGRNAKQKAEKNLDNIKKNIEKNNNSKAVTVTAEIAEEIKEDLQKEVIATPTDENTQ